jgi:hypothetical protein
MAMFRTNSGVLLQQLAGNYASNNVPNSYATELKVGYAARLFMVMLSLLTRNLQVV